MRATITTQRRPSSRFLPFPTTTTMVLLVQQLVLVMMIIQPVLAWDHILTREGLEQTLTANDVVLVAFVSPDESKSAALELDWLSAVAGGTAGRDHFASIDCVASKAVCDSFAEVSSYPSIVLFQLGKPLSQYRGARRAVALQHYITRFKEPVISEIASADDLAAFKTADETVFVAFLGPEHEVLKRAFAGAATRYREEFRFGAVVDPAVAAASGVQVPSIACYRPTDDDTVVHFPSPGEPEKLDAWVQEASRPVLGELTLLNRQRLIDRGYPMVYVFSSSEPERKQLRDTLYKFAKSYHDSLTSVMVDPLEFPDLMGQLGLEPNVFPAAAVHQLSNDRIFPHPKGRPLDPKGVQKWGLDVYQGRVKPWRPAPDGVTATTTYAADVGPTKVAPTRRVSIRSIPGVKIKISGHDEL
ncbi:thioredoxin-like domain-containing protein [Podospora didyma]|uniref:Protein disulfide-isomerase n=1 Tax=Podospora didyma TaxID=330526 RepID=A0AAE0N8U2_9PEZI|nr:thioredoxin-like domain-containing protein [Podospora didyma]